MGNKGLYYAKYKKRFFILLAKSLCHNTMLPAHIVAAFIKRLANRAMSAPPSSILYILALISNLLRIHPECIGLIHRERTQNDDDNDLEFDSYNAQTNNPVESNALNGSSLWELHALEKHYHPTIST